MQTITTSASNIGRRYLLHEPIGEGGMGIVYRATDRLTGRTLALKRVLRDVNKLAESNAYNATDFRLAMAQEFKLSASLRHPNIIKVLDYGFDDDKNPYYTMEYLPNARTIVDAGQDLSIPDRIDLLIQTLNALAYLHRRRILHRDLKPANILMVDNQVKVLDFGLSVMHEQRQQRSSESDTAAGTLAYIAPEALLANDSGIPADLYAIGMIAYELLAGEHPFNLDSPGQLVQQIMYTTPDIDALDLSAALTDILETLVQKDPQERYQSAEATLAALHQATGREDTSNSQDIQESYLRAARLVGRDKELRQLSDALTGATNGQGSAWLLAGENGVGKTRLMDELRRLAMVQGATVLRGKTLNIGNQPFQVWLMTLRWLCLLDDNLLDEEVALLKIFIDDIDTLVERDTRYIETATMDAEILKQWIISLLERIFKNQTNPVVVLLEDLHNAGSESLHILHHLSMLVEDMSVMLVGSYNDDETPDLNLSLSTMNIMKLRRLSPAAIADLSAAMLGDAGRSEQVLDLLQRETDGNVYFMIEVIQALAGSVGNLADIGRMTLPHRVFAQGMKSIIERRLGRINAEGMMLLQYAATMGTRLNVVLLQQILPQIDIQRALMHCADASVLEVQEETWSFTHNGLREGVLEGVAEDTLRQYHLDVAAAIEAHYGEASAFLHTLAYHYHEAEDDSKEEYFVSKAGTQSLQRGAYHEAIACFKRAQELVNRLRLDGKTTAYRQLELTIQIASAYTGIGAYDDARNWYQESLNRAITLHDTVHTALIHSYLGDVSLVLHENQVARQQYEMSLQLYERAQDNSGIARALNGLGNVAYEEGDNASATAFYQRSMNISRELGESRGMAGAIRQTQSIKTLDTRPFTYEETKELYSTALELYEKQQNSNGIADALYNLGLAAYEAEMFTEATSYLERSIPHLEKTEKTTHLAQVYNRLGRIATRQGKYTGARIYFDHAFHNLRHDPIETLPILLNLARLFIAKKEFETALRVLAFLLHYEASPEDIEDDAEILIFEIEGRVAADSTAWDSGKNSSYTDMVAYLGL